MAGGRFSPCGRVFGFAGIRAKAKKSPDEPGTTPVGLENVLKQDISGHLVVSEQDPGRFDIPGYLRAQGFE